MSPLALEYCRAQRLPLSTLWFGEHGDFQLLCGIPDKNLARAKKEIRGLEVLGRVRKPARTHTLRADGAIRPIRLDLLAESPKSSLAEIRRAFDRMVYYLSREAFP